MCGHWNTWLALALCVGVQAEHISYAKHTTMLTLQCKVHTAHHAVCENLLCRLSLLVICFVTAHMSAYSCAMLTSASGITSAAS